VHSSAGDCFGTLMTIYYWVYAVPRNDWFFSMVGRSTASPRENHQFRFDVPFFRFAALHLKTLYFRAHFA
jgi:hypothetical protein